MRRTRTHRHTHLHHTSTISTTTWPPPPPAVGSCIPQPPPPPPPSSHHRHVPLTMVVVVIVVVMVVMVSCVAGHNGELCVVETPLRTPYVRSHRVTPTTCLGCLFLPHHTTTTTTTTKSYDQVHVIEVEEAVGGVVEVGVVESNIGGDDKVVVVILSSSSSSSVMFKVFLSSSSSTTTASASRQVTVNATKFVFLVNEGDVMEVDGLQYSLFHQPLSSSTGDVISTGREQFGFVSSYTRVRRANELTVHLLDDGNNSKNNGGSGGCSSGSGGEVVVEEASPVVECEVVEEQAMSGCYHVNMLGRGDRDIHIIEVEKSIRPNSSLILSLVGGGEGVVERNVTLVLRASSPTTWHLHTTQLHGTVTLLMGGSDQVENISAIPGAVAVQVRKVDVPKNFDQLILTVLTSMGPPVSYTRSSAPTRITITVPRRMENHIHSHPHPPDYEAPTVYAEEPGSVIRAGLSVTCDPTAMTLALPYATAEKVGSIAMALSDRACVGSRNGTHIVLRAEFTQCKFSATVSPLGKITFDNMLSVELGPALSDDEDLVGSGYGSEDEYYPPAIPPMRVACPGEQAIPPPPQPRPPQPPPPPPPHQRKQGSSGGMRGATYTMVMYRDSGLLEPLTTPPLHHHTSTSMPTPVVLHSRLYVQASLASVLFRADSPTSSSTTDLRVVLEECWVSNTTSASPPPPTSASASTHTATHPRTLVRKSCRVDSSVAVDSPYAHSHTPTFSFQVLPEYAAWGTFYLHCQVGVCSTDSLPRPAVIRCIEPTLYCSKPALLHVFQGQPASSSLQTLTLGPLTTAATTKSALFGGVTRATTSTQGLNNNNNNSSSIVGEAGDGDDKTQIVVLGGLSTEIVVGIALASFVIGVCLTATLWVIHMKTDPRRQKRHPDSSSAPRNSGYDLSAHSGSSTPSSQAPMTA